MEACLNCFDRERALVAHGSCSPLSVSWEAPGSAFVAVWHFYWASCCYGLACPCSTHTYIWGSGSNISIYARAAEDGSCPGGIPHCCCLGAGSRKCWGSQGGSDVPEEARGVLMAQYQKVPSSCMGCLRWCCSPWETPRSPQAFGLSRPCDVWQTAGVRSRGVSCQPLDLGVPGAHVACPIAWSVWAVCSSKCTGADQTEVPQSKIFLSGTEMLLIKTCPWPNCTASSLAPVPCLQGSGFWKPSILRLSWKLHTFLRRVLLLCVAAPQESSVSFWSVYAQRLTHRAIPFSPKFCLLGMHVTCGFFYLITTLTARFQKALKIVCITMENTEGSGVWTSRWPMF